MIFVPKLENCYLIPIHLVPACSTDASHRSWLPIYGSQFPDSIQIQAICIAQGDFCPITCSHMVSIRLEALRGIRQSKAKAEDKHQECLSAHVHFWCSQHQSLFKRFPLITTTFSFHPGCLFVQHALQLTQQFVGPHCEQYQQKENQVTNRINPGQNP